MPIQIAPAYEPVEVDLWGELHKTRPITRSVERKIEKIRDELAAATTTDQSVKCFAKLIAVYLGDDSLTQKIDAKWKADEVTVNQLDSFLGAVVEADRPT